MTNTKFGKKPTYIHNVLPDLNLVNIIIDYENNTNFKRYFSNIVLYDLIATVCNKWSWSELDTCKNPRSYLIGCMECGPTRVFIKTGYSSTNVLSFRTRELDRTVTCYQCNKD